ncbi:hypothetical protein SAMN05660841_00128 [Sphingobacterium nematocida]|uniref:Uncharacterized protein n=1 Tax=Sphingobacterium nematocida TaxID=1513896 RepID=A0A1T5ASP0_9SPHI|nr:hypothetical protein [Sphingobacterium nematocida]SKB37879.1 hypothetical protein SAMN05660841_00128 [Sphingobacterium nematocida]
MHKIIKKISQAVQVLLLAPIKLPGKALNIVKYVAVGLGILEAMTSEKEEEEPVSNSLRDEES